MKLNINRLFSRHKASRQQVFSRPLLDDKEIHELGKLIFTTGKSVIPDYKSDLPTIGAAPSVQRGQGLDVLENRAYVYSDDPKHINWRMSARLGDLHTKILIEEKQTRALIIVDRRPPMRFGTQGRLKVTQAAIAAIALLYDLVRRSVSTEVIIVDTRITCLPIVHDSNQAFQIARAIAAPCDPGYLNPGKISSGDSATDINADGPVGNQNRSPIAEVDMRSSLRFLYTRYNTGYSFYYLSDFHDLGASSRNQLLGLAQNNDFHAIHIVDSAETELPHAGAIDIQLNADTRSRIINCDDSKLREAYRHERERKLAETRHTLTGSGNRYLSLMTGSDLFDADELHKFISFTRHGL